MELPALSRVTRRAQFAPALDTPMIAPIMTSAMLAPQQAMIATGEIPSHALHRPSETLMATPSHSEVIEVPAPYPGMALAWLARGRKWPGRSVC
ncbi:hypothetical protein ACU4GD_10350 [Cupriavidus basilensis]